MKKSAVLAICVLAIGMSGVLGYLHGQTPATNDKAEIEALVARCNDAFNARNVDKVMSCYAPGKSTVELRALHRFHEHPRQCPILAGFKTSRLDL